MPAAAVTVAANPPPAADAPTPSRAGGSFDRLCEEMSSLAAQPLAPATPSSSSAAPTTTAAATTPASAATPLSEIGRSRSEEDRELDFYIARAQGQPVSASKPPPSSATKQAPGTASRAGGASRSGAMRVAAPVAKGGAAPHGPALSKQPPQRVPKTPKSAGGGSMASGASRAPNSAAAADDAMAHSLFASDELPPAMRTPTSATKRLESLATPRANQTIRGEAARQMQKGDGKNAKTGPGGTVVQPRMVF